MSYFTIRIEESDHLRQTPLTPEDIEDILSLLGHPKKAIAAARITVLPSHATVHWTDKIAVSAQRQKNLGEGAGDEPEERLADPC